MAQDCGFPPRGNSQMRSSTIEEGEVSRMLQDFWIEFAKDPEHGLHKVV
jgi:hypothetical protein